MGRKSTIDQRSEAFRKHVFKRLREGRLTLDELRVELEGEFPDEPTPSRSALGRHRASVEEMISHEREMAAAAEALVGELGEDFDAKSGALLAQAVTTLTSRYAMGQLQSGKEMDIADVLDLARAAKTAQEARSLNLKERREVERIAREKLLEEQAKALEASRKELGVSEDTLRAIRAKLGIV
ncbi:MAG: DUF3486 family protein [Zoogloea sp.]|uniref:phage protein Gp27 family protein n=1 Tax=Zoogloea sp. TaxID=49181 RepID=UPI0026027F33|nr:phage protein Gp27 family protein [Zoogloea sp.]MDD3328339.1 DUF3486 family protein [Zoogloea sp.]